MWGVPLPISFMETQEINSITELPTAIVPPTEGDDYELMRMVKNLKVATRDEVRTEIDTLQTEVAELQEQLSQTTQRLEPLLRFEALLNRKLSDPLSIRLFDLSETNKEKLLALARLYYPNMSNKFDHSESSIEKGRDPLNQLMSDLMAFLLIGPAEQCMLASLFRGNRQRGLTINDK